MTMSLESAAPAVREAMRRTVKGHWLWYLIQGALAWGSTFCLRPCLLRSLIVVVVPAYAADADNGERLAQRWCVACHIVTTAQTSTTTDQAPPFPTIAKKPDFDAAKLTLFLLDPHPKMPDMGLSRKEATDLAAYIATLK